MRPGGASIRMGGMLRAALLIAVLAAAALGLLTVVKAPDWLSWYWAVLAGEYGHWVALGPLAAAALAWRVRAGHPATTVVTVALGAAAIALLLNPAAQAWRIGRALPAELERDFGRVELERRPFSFPALFAPGTRPMPFETMAYAGPLQLDFYRAAGRVPAPCVIVVHGGGWNNGDRGEIRQLDDWLARRGYAVAAISYRLAPGAVWPAQRDDLMAAIAYVKAQAPRLGVDPARLVLLGRSAGGQIAEATAYAAHDPSIRGVVGLYAPADMNFAWAWGREDDALKSPQLLRQFLGGPPAVAGAAYDSASGIRLVGPTSPPTLLVHGRLDTLVWYRQSERLAARLAACGVPHALVSLPWATHAVEYNLRGPGGQLATYALEWFLAAATR